MGETCTIQGVQELNQINLIIEGEDAGLLIGKQGQTLEALQYLVTKILSKQTKKKPRVVIDIESYRERHKQSLVELALKHGAKAKRIGKPVTLNPMNAHDRRIVHLALQQDKEIKTKSRGEGLYKKIIIYPVKKKRSHGGSERARVKQDTIAAISTPPGQAGIGVVRLSGPEASGYCRANFSAAYPP